MGADRSRRGGGSRERGNNLAVLHAFADHIVRGDPATRHVLFDIAYVSAPDDTALAATSLAEQKRRISMKRFLFGSDFNVLTPQEEIRNLRKLGLTNQEWQTLRENSAPWAC